MSALGRFCPSRQTAMADRVENVGFLRVRQDGSVKSLFSMLLSEMGLANIQGFIFRREVFCLKKHGRLFQHNRP
jgi:hypothetical protein